MELNLDKAIPLFKEAVAIDTGSHRRIARWQLRSATADQDREGQILALERAYAHSDRLPEIERLLTIAAYWNRGRAPTPQKAAQAYESLLVIRPTHYAALNNLALIYADRRDFHQGRGPTSPVDRRQSLALTSYGNLTSIRRSKGRLLRWTRPSSPSSRRRATIRASRCSRVSILFSQGKYDSTDALIDSIVKVQPRSAPDLIQQRNAGHRGDGARSAESSPRAFG